MTTAGAGAAVCKAWFSVLRISWGTQCLLLGVGTRPILQMGRDGSSEGN